MYKKLCFTLSMVVSLFAVSANGAPMAYSINSDSGNSATEDSLYLIDLETGIDKRRGPLTTGIQNDFRRDTEGLAFDRDGRLWGVDDGTRTLFPINIISGSINSQEEITLPSFQIGGSHDFGMTFSCDNSLYLTSVVNRTLYRVDMGGSSHIVGSKGALGANISAIAANGSTTTLYGLGNGQFANGDTDSPNLYSIDMTTGVATLIGPLGSEAGEYNQGGLDFDAEGQLWAITDRRIINNSIENKASQILRINIETGAATLVSTTVSEVGFESLAISSPSVCGDGSGSGRIDAAFKAIPTLDLTGRVLAIFVLMLAGITILRRRIS
jgi:hypothetical protein